MLPVEEVALHEQELTLPQREEKNELEEAILNFDISIALRLINSGKQDLETRLPTQYSRTYLNLLCTGSVGKFFSTTIVNYPAEYCALVETLLRCGADVTTVDRFGRTPLANVIHYQAYRLFKILLLHGTVSFDGPELKCLKQCDNIAWIINIYQELKKHYLVHIPLPNAIRHLILYYTIPKLPKAVWSSKLMNSLSALFGRSHPFEE